MAELSPWKKNRDLLFWSLHALGWGAYAISHYLGALIYWKPAGYNKVIFVAAAAGFVISSPLRYACRWLWGRSAGVVIAGALASAYAVSAAWRVVVNQAYIVFLPEYEEEVQRWTDYFSGTVSGMYLTVCWIGLYFGFKYYESLQLQREAALRASALAQEAQFKMLRYQLNPHFLFNTLNAISTLILDNRNSTANSAVTGLAEFLRYTLDQDPIKKVTVAQELDALNLYLDIEKMRFGPRLAIEFAIEPAAMNMQMPSLLLQPLIENAIKYAISPREEGGRIRIGGELSGNELRLAVSDDGPGMGDPSRLTNGRGVGIRNTRERLQVLYGEKGKVLVSNSHPGLQVLLSFPAEPAAPSQAQTAAA
jgi:two-component system LytT family sensor kinase